MPQSKEAQLAIEQSADQSFTRAQNKISKYVFKTPADLSLPEHKADESKFVGNLKQIAQKLHASKKHDQLALQARKVFIQMAKILEELSGLCYVISDLSLDAFLMHNGRLYLAKEPSLIALKNNQKLLGTVLYRMEMLTIHDRKIEAKYACLLGLFLYQFLSNNFGLDLKNNKNGAHYPFLDHPFFKTAKGQFFQNIIIALVKPNPIECMDIRCLLNILHDTKLIKMKELSYTIVTNLITLEGDPQGATALIQELGSRILYAKTADMMALYADLEKLEQQKEQELHQVRMECQAGLGRILDLQRKGITGLFLNPFSEEEEKESPEESKAEQSTLQKKLAFSEADYAVIHSEEASIDALSELLKRLNNHEAKVKKVLSLTVNQPLITTFFPCTGSSNIKNKKKRTDALDDVLDCDLPRTQKRNIKSEGSGSCPNENDFKP